MTENRYYYKSEVLKKLYNNQCTYVSKAGRTPGTRCKKLTGVNRFFCPEHFKQNSRGNK